MFNLVKNELTKIFNKKGIYIVLIIFLLFTSLILGIQKYSESIVYSYLEDTNVMVDIDTSTDEGKVEYWNEKTSNEINKLANKYGGYTTWQGEKILTDVWAIKLDMNLYENGLGDFAVYTNYTKEELTKEYEKIMGRIEKGDWKSFVEEELKETQEEISSTEETLKITKDDDTRKEINKNLEILKLKEQSNKWRLEKEIPYRDSKYDSALDNYYSYGSFLVNNNYQYNINEKNYKEKISKEFDYSSKLQYQTALEQFNIAKYCIENEIQTSNETVSGVLEDLISSMGILFIIIISVMITGTIVSEEFNKNTIKLLLIRPYTRKKILLSKIIASIIAILIAILCMVLIQTVVSGIIYGFDTINIPVLKYNFNTNSVMEFNVFVWLIIDLINVSPIIIILSTMALTVGTLLTNSSSAITLSILSYMGANILKQIAIYSTKIKWLKFIPFVNWNLSDYMFGKLSQLQGATLPIAILTCSIFVVIMLIVTFENFARKNIKNI